MVYEENATNFYHLRNKQQFVGISDSISAMVRIEYGVPQGSVLGPLLFILYNNDLKNALMSKPRLFADDTCLLIKNNNLKRTRRTRKSEIKHASILDGCQ